MKNRFLLIILVIATTGMFFSCKKETSCENCTAKNQSPVAVAGPQQIIIFPTDSISLDGSASHDPDGTISNWLWTKISGPASFNIVSSSQSQTKVEALVTGIYQFELKVTDNKGASAKDTVQVMVDNPAVNQPPVANAGADQTISLPVNSTILNGSASADPDNNITAYVWTKISGPTFFSNSNANAVQTEITNLAQGVYQFELKVTDAGNLFSKDTVQISVVSSVPVNQPPMARAGNDTIIFLPSSVAILNGSASADPDNNITSYLWTKISGPSSFNIVNGNAVQTQVTNLAEGVYLFELRVTNAGGLIAKDTIQVTVNASPPIETDRDIYVAGSEYNGTKFIANYWKNGVAVPLTDGTKDAKATSMTVVGSDVYVAGYETNGNNIHVAKYWKNGVAILLTDGTKYAEAWSIAVVGSDVYVAGYETNGSNIHVAKYWKNGVEIPLTNGSTYACANSIVVVGSDVYVAGFEGKFAKYWKNGQQFVLNDGTKWARANSIAVVGSDVYVAGYDDDGATEVVKYWKNGIAVTLNQGDNSEATSIAVVGGNVSVAGYNDGTGPDMAKYWKNGQEFGLSAPNNSAFAMGITVAGSDVYVVGSESAWDWDGNHWKASVAKYWKNGVAVPLTDGTKSAFAHSIAVVQR